MDIDRTLFRNVELQDDFFLFRGALDHQYKIRSFIELFDAQVKLKPDAIALICKDQNLAYQELWLRSVQFANRLIHSGIKPGQIVALK